MKNTKLKQIVLLLGLMLPTIFGMASVAVLSDGPSPIIIKEALVQGIPKTNSILATIDGHFLSVTFTENLGQVSIDISTATGLSVDFISSPTPNGVMFYIPNTGSYVITFTLPNGDQYYGEFEVTD